MRVSAQLEELHERMAGVIIERMPWAGFLAKYDTPETLFYLDPPYWGGEGDYGPGMFAREEFDAMAEALARLQGRFILSINDRPETRAVFGRFKVDEVSTLYGLAGQGAKPAAELIVTG